MPGPLAHSPADITRKAMVLLGLGTMPSQQEEWPIFTALEPASPDNCVTVYDTTGRQSGRTHNDGEVQEHHGIQVRVRAKTHNEGWNKARAIAHTLDTGVYQRSVLVEEYGTPQAYLIHSFSRTSDVAALGRESPESDRRLFTVNYLVSVRQES